MVRVLLVLCGMETLCDACIISQESHNVGYENQCGEEKKKGKRVPANKTSALANSLGFLSTELINLPSSSNIPKKQAEKAEHNYLSL